MLLNLLVNAIEAIEETDDTGAGKITLQTAHADGRIAVTVVDNGVGFDPFVTTKAEGMGMGLSISHTIAKAHGGRPWATRNPEGGATFHLSLPVPLRRPTRSKHVDT